MVDKGLVEIFVEKRFGGIREYWGYQVESCVCLSPAMAEGRQKDAVDVWML